MKNFIKMITMCLLITACGEFEPTIFDQNNGQTFAYFSNPTSSLEVLINETGTVDIEVGVNTLSSSDRTVTVSVEPDFTTANADMYSFSSTVTIPANEYFGTFTVTGMDNGLTTSAVTVTLKIDSVDGGVVSPSTHALSLVEICPVDAAFAVGDYTLNHVSGGIDAAGFAPAMGDDVVVTLVPGASGTERVFNVKFYPSFGFANPPASFSFNLICEETVSNGIIEGASGVGCGGSIEFGPSTNNGTYDVADDTSIRLVFFENTNEMCGNGSVETIVTLTKI